MRAIGPRLIGVLRPGDTIARFGGGGFGILCEGIADEAHTARVAGRIVDAFDDPFLIDGRKRRVSASVGVALAAAGQSVQALSGVQTTSTNDLRRRAAHPRCITRQPGKRHRALH